MRFWFKDGVEDSQTGPFLGKKYSGGFEELRVCSFSGKKYYDTHMDFLDLTTELPCAAFADLVEKVTIKDHIIHHGFRTDGVYYHQGSSLVVETKETVHSGKWDEYGGTKIEREVWQIVSITAPSVEALRAIYSQFRQGVLKPTEDWEANSRAPQANEPTDPRESEEVPITKPGKERGYGYDY